MLLFVLAWVTCCPCRSLSHISADGVIVITTVLAGSGGAGSKGRSGVLNLNGSLNVGSQIVPCRLLYLLDTL